MDKLIGMAVVGGATVISIAVALLLEGVLLKVLLGLVARSRAEEVEAAAQSVAQPPSAVARELRSLALR
jgi:hypothetical protein